MNLLLLFSAWAASANVNCLTENQKYKVEIVDSTAESAPVFKYYEKQKEQLKLIHQTAVSVHENIRDMQIEFTGQKAYMNIQVDGDLYTKQQAQVQVLQRELSMNCDIENQEN